jgi:MGT family glycosyltransferase
MPGPGGTKRRIVLTTFGSLGDLHPYVAVALELQRRGHEAVIATSGRYRTKVEALGIAFRAVRPDVEDTQLDAELMRGVMDPRTGSEVVIRDLVMPHVRDSYDDLAAACDGADLVVGHVLTFAARLLSEKTGIRWASSVLQPIAFLSAHDPPVMPTAQFLRRLRFLGPGFNRALFALARRMSAPWTEPWHRLRAELGLPPTTENPIFEGQHAPSLVLALFSSRFAAKASDWPQHTVVTGFPFFDQDGDAGLPPDLTRFLDGGEPPIVFTLGTSAVMDAGDFYEVGAEAAGRLGRRAVLLVGRDAPPRTSPLPPGVAAFAYAPYSQLFPRAAAIVHQGGVGTTAQAMRSARPMIVMPYGHDQPDNAERVRRLGISRTVARRAFTAERAVRELRHLLDDPSYAARSAEVGRVVAAEDGARTAADAIERLLLG